MENDSNFFSLLKHRPDRPVKQKPSELRLIDADSSIETNDEVIGSKISQNESPKPFNSKFTKDSSIQ